MVSLLGLLLYTIIPITQYEHLGAEICGSCYFSWETVVAMAIRDRHRKTWRAFEEENVKSLSIWQVSITGC